MPTVASKKKSSASQKEQDREHLFSCVYGPASASSDANAKPTAKGNQEDLLKAIFGQSETANERLGMIVSNVIRYLEDKNKESFNDIMNWDYKLTPTRAQASGGSLSQPMSNIELTNRLVQLTISWNNMLLYLQGEHGLDAKKMKYYFDINSDN